MAAATELLYFTNCQMLKSTAKLLQITPVITQGNEPQYALVFDRTVFHGQGGGQPGDIGVIKSVTSNEEFNVTNTNFDPENPFTVVHKGHFSSNEAEPSWKQGMEFQMEVDPKTRNFNSRVHTAGHMIDLAVGKCGFKWNPTKGYHYPSGAYVEYNLTPDDAKFVSGNKKEIQDKIGNVCNEIISESDNYPIKIMATHNDQTSSDDNDTHTHTKPHTKQSLRSVTIGDVTTACGGTHTNTLSEIGEMCVRKMDCKVNKGTLRVSYEVK